MGCRTIKIRPFFGSIGTSNRCRRTDREATSCPVSHEINLSIRRDARPRFRQLILISIDLYGTPFSIMPVHSSHCHPPRGLERIHDFRLVCPHLRNFNDRKWYVAALLSWGIALFEYLFQVPANRIGYSQYSLGQLKILQEVITLSVFAPFALFYMRQPLKL